MREYMTDEELLKLINEVEKNDIVEVPPGLTEIVIDKINRKNKLIEYKRFRNRVIASVAAILIVTINAPYASESIKKLSYNDNALNYKNIENELNYAAQKSLFGDLGESYRISNLLNRKED